MDPFPLPFHLLLPPAEAGAEGEVLGGHQSLGSEVEGREWRLLCVGRRACTIVDRTMCDIRASPPPPPPSNIGKYRTARLVNTTPIQI